MRVRSLVISYAVVAAVAAAGWMLLDSRTKTDSHSEVSPASVAAPAHDDDRPGAEPVQTTPAPSLTPQRIASDQNGNSGERTVIDGAVIVTDAAGVEHDKENGTLVPWIRNAQSLKDDIKEIVERGPPPLRRLDPVAVTRGRFHLELPGRPGQLRVVLHMTLGGRPARFDDGCSEARLIDNAQRGLATIRAHWIEAVLLHVVDKESGRELDEVAVVRRRDVARRPNEYVSERATSTSYHPGPPEATETLLEHARSPLVVHPHFVQGAMKEFDEWFVRARDHAWARINVHFDESVERTTERTLELGAGATLVVDVQGELPQPRVTPSGDKLVPMLRLRQETQMAGMPVKRLSETIVAEAPAALGEIRFESLEASAITASIELGRPFDQPLVVQHVRADLAAGATERVAIELTPEVVPKPVPLAGALFIPAGWEVPDGHLVIRRASHFEASDSEEHDLPLSQLKPLPDRPGWYSWNAGMVLPAEFEFAVEVAGFAYLETIEPPGNEHVELSLAEPARLDVDVVDEATGEKVVLNWVAWRAHHDQAMRWGSGLIQLGYDPVRRLYSGVVPVGQGVVCGPYGRDWTIDDARADTKIHPGEQILTVAVHRTIGVAVELMCGTTKVPWTEPLTARCTVEALDDAGARAFRALRDGTLVVGVTAAGCYRVTIPEIPGYAPVEPFEINLPEGRFITRVVYLTKP